MIAWVIKKCFSNLVLFTDEAKVLVEHIQGLLVQMFGWIKPVHIQGALYTSIATLVVVASMLGSEGAKANIGQTTLFWLLFINAAVSAALNQLKSYMSSSYADHAAEKKNGNTQFISKPPGTP